MRQTEKPLADKPNGNFAAVAWVLAIVVLAIVGLTGAVSPDWLWLDHPKLFCLWAAGVGALFPVWALGIIDLRSITD